MHILEATFVLLESGQETKDESIRYNKQSFDCVTDFYKSSLAIQKVHHDVEFTINWVVHSFIVIFRALASHTIHEALGLIFPTHPADNRLFTKIKIQLLWKYIPITLRLNEPLLTAKCYLDHLFQPC